MTDEIVLALDIGATKLAAGMVDCDGNVLSQAQVPTQRTAQGELVFKDLFDVAEMALAGQQPGLVPNLVGVSCAGPMLPGAETVSPLSIQGWRGFPLRGRLEEAFKVPVFADIDAKALVLAEKWKGAGQESDNLLAMVVSSGVGAGIILNGRLLHGRLGNAGHIGHVIVQPEGRMCPCGGYGCLEAEASGLSIEAMTGHPPAQATPEVVERTGRMVGIGVASVANLLDLELALVGGSVALGFGEPFFQAAQAEIHRRCKMDFVREVRIRPVGLGANASLIGAAAVALQGSCRSGRI